ncbi:NAD-dependent epimerase/dehydratase [Kalymmatonema gypsitolerans NIES-4073]|nr:NAD-dependent epimerase/dehydratase [Scytonema sp. NIES-4073]
MKILIAGATGAIGRPLVTRLVAAGHEVIGMTRTSEKAHVLTKLGAKPVVVDAFDAVAASPSSGVNAVTGEGLSEVLVDAKVVVDATNSPSFEDTAVLEFFLQSSRNLLAAEALAGVSHHIAVSIVGAERIPDSGYMRAKVAQEKLIQSAAIPYTIVRQFLSATQDTRQVVVDSHARYFGAALNDQLVPYGNSLIGSTRFEDWLNRSIAKNSEQ